MNPVDLVQEQLEAYNARDLDRFAAVYADSIRLYRMPTSEATTVGKEKFREVYASRFSSPNLHATIVNRMVLGNKVIDHERVVGIKETPVEVAAVYEIESGLIQKVWFFYP
jgi:hypothetical protein